MVKINPDDYQKEQENTYDYSLTKEEKVKLLIYLSCIVLGFALLLGLFKSGEVVHNQEVIDTTIRNLTSNSSLVVNRWSP